MPQIKKQFPKMQGTQKHESLQKWDIMSLCFQKYSDFVT